MRIFPVILVLLLAELSAAVALPNNPSIVFESVGKDLGKVTQGEIVEHVFVFTNKGTGTLEILNASPSCGCQAVLIREKRIQAGKNGQIGIKINTENMFGAIEEMVNVTTNDPNQPIVTLTVKMIVDREFEISEPNIYFGNAPEGKEVCREIIITLPAQKSIRILSAESTDPNIMVRIEPVVGSNNKKWKLIAIQKVNAKLGYHFGKIIVKTSSPRTPTISIYENGIIIPRDR
jgi:hypothetical protein